MLEKFYQGSYGIVQWRWNAQASAFLHDVAVNRVDLRFLASPQVLAERCGMRGSHGKHVEGFIVKDGPRYIEHRCLANTRARTRAMRFAPAVSLFVYFKNANFICNIGGTISHLIKVSLNGDNNGSNHRIKPGNLRRKANY